MFEIFSKKCKHCKMKIEKGDEILKDAATPGHASTKSNLFCCAKHAEKYKQEAEKAAKASKKKKNCCG